MFLYPWSDDPIRNEQSLGLLKWGEKEHNSGLQVDIEK